MSTDLLDVEPHFKFGENWSSYAELLNPERIEQAQADLQRILGRERLDGLTFLDIGSGSGLHSLAAIRMGAAEILAVDIDPDSVRTTQEALCRFAPDAKFTCRQVSIFEATPEDLGQFDIVYSWGVLHHTGDIHEAIRRASTLVKPDGLLALAIYRKTVLCGFWKVERRIYRNLPSWGQSVVQGLYTLKNRLRFLIKGESFSQYLQDYHAQRGMDYQHDIHDWLGDYPYESMTPREFGDYVTSLGFEVVAPAQLDPKQLWTLSSGGCQEIRFRRAA
jgi:2-polyprenyl-6-hydroxyphenyl methylase/3-demethylubiquinone-9 3-methyltransferase